MRFHCRIVFHPTKKNYTLMNKKRKEKVKTQKNYKTNTK